MKPSTTVRLRAYLVTASLSAVLLQLGALLSIFAFGVPEQYFQTLAFRLGAAGAICAMVLTSTAISHVAFRSAVARHHAILDDSEPYGFSVSRGCPLRPLVMLHLKMKHDGAGGTAAE